MKFTTVFLILSLFLVYSCKDSPTRPGAILDENYEPITPQGTTAATPPPATAEPAQNAQGVWHYTCPNNCAGGGGSATPCGVCGTTLVHNQAYHANTGAATATNTITPTNTGGSPMGSITNPVINGVGAPAATTMVNPGAPPAGAAPPTTPEPAQNASGVWHYTCSAGCAGGAGSAVACAGCGATLVHNSAYHN